MLLSTLAATLLGNMLAGKGTTKAGDGMIKAGYESSIKKKILISPRPLTNLIMEKCYQNEHKFNGFHSRDNVPDKIKDWACVIFMSILILELIELLCMQQVTM